VLAAWVPVTGSDRGGATCGRIAVERFPSGFGQLEAPSVMRDTAKCDLALEPLDEVAVPELGRDAEICRQLGHGRTRGVLRLVRFKRAEDRSTKQLHRAHLLRRRPIGTDSASNQATLEARPPLDERVASQAALRAYSFVAVEPDGLTGKRIAAARKDVRLSQRALADELGVSLRTLQNYEAGKFVPYRHLDVLSMLLGRHPSWLLYGHEQPDVDQLVARSRHQRDRLKTNLSRLVELRGQLHDIAGRPPSAPREPTGG
jgi:transcriptional regulator with XRE-family HTH domain